MHPSQDPIIITALVTSLILCGLFTVFVIIIVSTQRRYYARQQTAFRSEVDTLKKERIRIAADLHDELSPMLTLAYRQVEAVVEQRQNAAELLPLAKSNLKTLITRISEVIYNMDDERIIKDGFEHSVRLFLRQHVMLSNLQVRFSCTLRKELSPQYTISLYRMLQELVQNTIKHSKASFIVISIKEWQGFLYFYYADDGASYAQAAIHEGMGLKSLQHRAMLLGGSLEVEHRNGAHYHFQIPVQ